MAHHGGREVSSILSRASLAAVKKLKYEVSYKNMMISFVGFAIARKCLKFLAIF